ncbi:unnamed protein product [Cunninghamella blakesleeana]
MGLFIDIVKRNEKAIATTLLGKPIPQSTKEKQEADVKAEDQELCLAMIQISLPLILDSIQEQQRIENDNIGSIQLLQIYSIQLKHMISTSMITIYFQQVDHIQDITFFCSMLLSISSRLSNAFGLHHMVNVDISNLDNTWYLDRNFYATVAKNVALELDKIYYQINQSNHSKHAAVKLNLAGELVGKMMRQGYQDISLGTMMPIAIQQYRLNKDSKYSDIWVQLWIYCEKLNPKEKLYNSILRYLNDYLENQKRNLLSSATSTNSNTDDDNEKIKRETIIQNLIQSTAYIISPLLFSKCTATELDSEFSSSLSHNQMNMNMKRINGFLTYIFTSISKVKLMNSLVSRLVMAIAMHSSGLICLDKKEIEDNHAYELSKHAKEVLDHSLKSLIDLWSDPIFINHSSDSEHLYVTNALLIHFGYADKIIMEDVLYTSSLGMAISSWLKTADEVNAKLGMIVAECLSARTKHNDEDILDFEVPMEQILIDMKKLAFMADGLTKVIEVSLDNEPIITEPEDESSDSEVELDPDALMTVDRDDDSDLDSEEEDSDLEPYPMEDESDNEFEDGANFDPKKKKPKLPVYISELSAYLKDQEDPERLEIGLKAAEPLLRQKMGVGTEIDEWAITLAQRIIYFPESYEITDYKKLQQKALVALMVACPRKIVYYSIEQIFDQNTSINQKSIILSSISLTAYELSGWESLNEKSKTLEMEMEKLNLFVSAPASSSSSSSLEKLEESHGKILFNSTRHEAEQRRQKNIKRNQLSGLAASVFFFPLVVGWWEALQTRMRWIEQDPMLVERFIMTLNVILQCASHTPDRRKIVKEYFEYALSLRFIPNLSYRVTRALLLGIHTIIHICYKDQSQLLLSDYASELSSTHDWLESLLEKEQKNEDIQQLILGILASLVKASKVNSYEVL